MTGSKSAEQVLERLERLYEIGGGKGANRPGLSAAEDAAHDLASGWMEEAGLAVERDAWGNLFGRLAGSDPAAGELWTGSHLDTVPAGGRFDGAARRGRRPRGRPPPRSTGRHRGRRGLQGRGRICLCSRVSREPGPVRAGRTRRPGSTWATASDCWGRPPGGLRGGSYRAGPGSRACRRSARHRDLDFRAGARDNRVHRSSASCRDDADGCARGRTLLRG